MQVLFKLDKTGTGEEICMADMPNNQGLSFVGFTPTMFLEVCVCLAQAHKLPLEAAPQAQHCRSLCWPLLVCIPASGSPTWLWADVHHGRLRLRQGAARGGHEEGARAHAQAQVL